MKRTSFTLLRVAKRVTGLQKQLSTADSFAALRNDNKNATEQQKKVLE